MTARSRRLLACEVLVLVGAGIVAALSSTASDWEPIELFVVLLALALVSDLLAGPPRRPAGLGLVPRARAGDGAARAGPGRHDRRRLGARRPAALAQPAGAADHQPRDLGDVPAGRRAADRVGGRGAGRAGGRPRVPRARLRGLPGRQPPQLPRHRGRLRVPPPRVAGERVPHDLPAGPPLRARQRAAVRAGRGRVRAQRLRRAVAARGRARRLPVPAAGAPALARASGAIGQRCSSAC